MAVINTSAGNEAVLKIYDLDSSGAIVDANVLTIPFMQDVTVNNSTGTFRFKTLDSGSESVVTTPSTNQLSLSEAFLQNLSNWSSGTIKSGFNTQSEIESCTITFNPTPAAPKYLYIVYDNDRGSVNKVLNTDSTYNENDGVNWLNETHGNYKVYYTSLPKDATLNYKLEF